MGRKNIWPCLRVLQLVCNSNEESPYWSHDLFIGINQPGGAWNIYGVCIWVTSLSLVDSKLPDSLSTSTPVYIWSCHFPFRTENCTTIKARASTQIRLNHQSGIHLPIMYSANSLDIKFHERMNFLDGSNQQYNLGSRHWFYHKWVVAWIAIAFFSRRFQIRCSFKWREGKWISLML